MNTNESLSRVGNDVKNMVAKNRKRLTRNIIVECIILIFVICYLSWTRNRVAQVDADVLVARVQLEAKQKLPELSNQLADRLNNYAPELMENLKQKVLDLIPTLSKKLEDELDVAMEIFCKISKDQMEQLGEIIRQEKETLDKQQETKMPDKEQIDLLMKNVRANLRAKLLKSTEPVREDYSKMLKDISDKLNRLALDDKSLTEKEILQKRLIEVWVKLIKMKTGGNILK